MKRTFLGFMMLFPLIGFSQLKYPSYADVTATISGFNSKGISSTAVIGKSYGNENIAVIKLQRDEQPRPTLLLVSGLDGKHPTGTVSALEITKHLLALPN